MGLIGMSLPTYQQSLIYVLEREMNVEKGQIYRDFRHKENKSFRQLDLSTIDLYNGSRIYSLQQIRIVKVAVALSLVE